MDVPRTLLVTNDYPPAVGGIQRTSRLSSGSCRPTGRGVLPRSRRGGGLRRGGRVLGAPPARRLLVAGARRGRQDRASGTRGRRGGGAVRATYPLGMLGPRLSAAGLYVAAAHGFEYWLSIAPGTHAAMRYATSKAARVAVMCSEFVARTVRTAVPWRVPVSVLYPGADIEAFRPGLHPGPARASPPGRAATGRVRKQARGSEGSGRADPGMERIRRKVPEATLVIVGGGPARAGLRSLADAAPSGSVVFVGQVSEQDLPRYYSLGDVFAMPCRTRSPSAWRSRAGATCSSRPRRVADRSSSVIPAAPARPSSTGRRGPGRRHRRRGRRRRRRRAARRSRSRPDHGGGRQGQGCATTPGRRSPAGWCSAPGRGGLSRSLSSARQALRRSPAWGYPGPMDPGPAGGDRRCPDCGALASLDAEWCGQCLRLLKEPEPEPNRSRRAGAGGVATAVGDRLSTTSRRTSDPPAWPCPTCGART